MSRATSTVGGGRQHSRIGPPPRLCRQHHEPHSLGNGWLKEIVMVAEGLWSTPWGLYNDEEVKLAEAAEMSPRAVRLYAAEMIKELGLTAQVDART